MATNTNKTFMVMLSYASIVAFTAALIFCIVRITKSVLNLINVLMTSWALMQLQHELTGSSPRWSSITPIVFRRRITLRYDILGRLPVLMSGKLKESISQQYKVSRIIERIYDRVVDHKPQLYNHAKLTGVCSGVNSTGASTRSFIKSIASTFQDNALTKGSMDIRLSSLRNALWL